MKNIKKTRVGVTLIELIITIAIIGIIIVSFLPLFTMSAKTNSRSKDTLDSIYIGRDTMELIYSLIKTNDLKNDAIISYDQFITYFEGELKDKYIKVIGKDYEDEYEHEHDDMKYERIGFDRDGNLIKVIVKVYKDKRKYESLVQPKVQYESRYPLNGSGN